METIDPSFGLMIGISLGCMLWAAAIAGTKQRNMLLFGALGLLLGLIGVFIAFVVPPRPERPLTYDDAQPGITPASSR